MSKLKEFLDKNKISERRLLAASCCEEKLHREDRAIKLARKAVRGGNASDAQKEVAAKPRRSGRKVSAPLLHRATTGKKISRWARKRITRAVNRVLKQRKKGEVERAELFPVK